MQAITPELEAILKDHFQAAAQGFRCRVEIDVLVDPGIPHAYVQSASSGVVAAGGVSVTVPLPAPVTPGNLLVSAFLSTRDDEAMTWPAGWTQIRRYAPATGNYPNQQIDVYSKIADGTETGVTVTHQDNLGNQYAVHVYEFSGFGAPLGYEEGTVNASDVNAWPAISVPTKSLVMAFHSRVVSDTPRSNPPAGWTLGHQEWQGLGDRGLSASMYLLDGSGSYSPTVSPEGPAGDVTHINLLVAFGGQQPTYETISLTPLRVEIHKGLTLTADQAIVEFANEE